MEPTQLFGRSSPHGKVSLINKFQSFDCSGDSEDGVQTAPRSKRLIKATEASVAFILWGVSTHSGEQIKLDALQYTLNGLVLGFHSEEWC